MKLQAQLGDKRQEVDVRSEGDKVFATVGGRRYELEISEPEPGILLFKNNGIITEVFVSPRAGVSDPFPVLSGGSLFEVRLIDPKRMRGSGGTSDHADGAAEIRTAMPGKVVRIIQRPGAEVAKGDGVMVVEAMKMQNELKAPRAGTVKEVFAEEGQTVAAGQVLATIE